MLLSAIVTTPAMGFMLVQALEECDQYRGIYDLTTGDELKMVPDDSNDVDQFAVKVLDMRDGMISFIPSGPCSQTVY